jgi:rhodanese-related sulfurtransferase
MIETLTATQLKAWLDDATRVRPTLLDVRENSEVARGHIDGIQPIPMHEIPGRLAEIDADRPVVCICHHGGRSMQVAQFLAGQGRSAVINLTGGVDAWSREVDATLPRY